VIEFVYAFLLGMMSIISPCTFIVIPLITMDLNSKLMRIFSFLSGITIIFIILGILSAITGKLLTNFLGPYLYLFAGAITLIAGLDILNLIEINLPTIFTGIKTKNNFLMGLIYGGVALSCIGPLMAPVLAYITAKTSILYGALMMAFFSLGFIIPFILFGFLMTDDRISKKLMKYTLTIRKIGGALLLSGYLFFIAFRGII